MSVTLNLLLSEKSGYSV